MSVWFKRVQDFLALPAAEQQDQREALSRAIGAHLTTLHRQNRPREYMGIIERLSPDPELMSCIALEPFTDMARLILDRHKPRRIDQLIKTVDPHQRLIDAVNPLIEFAALRRFHRCTPEEFCRFVGSVETIPDFKVTLRVLEATRLSIPDDDRNFHVRMPPPEKDGPTGFSIRVDFKRNYHPGRTDVDMPYAQISCGSLYALSLLALGKSWNDHAHPENRKTWGRVVSEFEKMAEGLAPDDRAMPEWVRLGAQRELKKAQLC